MDDEFESFFKDVSMLSASNDFSAKDESKPVVSTSKSPSLPAPLPVIPTPAADPTTPKTDLLLQEVVNALKLTNTHLFNLNQLVSTLNERVERLERENATLNQKLTQTQHTPTKHITTDTQQRHHQQVTIMQQQTQSHVPTKVPSSTATPGRNLIQENEAQKTAKLAEQQRKAEEEERARALAEQQRIQMLRERREKEEKERRELEARMEEERKRLEAETERKKEELKAKSRSLLSALGGGSSALFDDDNNTSGGGGLGKSGGGGGLFD